MTNTTKDTLSLTLQMVLFILLVPVLYATGLNFDRAFGWDMDTPLLFRILTVVIIISGAVLFMWTLRSLFMAGHHIPSSDNPAPKLVVTGPFHFVRNPHALAIGIWLFGFSLFFSSVGFMLTTFVLFALILYVMKFGEEKELEERFGKEYSEYKQKTPFIIPRISQK
ncbi:MAG: isoprenylcysteine carboxylmethyltransferase family protein [Patescibacteria group bacterium]